MTDRTDDFNRADGGLGANWTNRTDANNTGSLVISSNKAVVNATNADCVEVWSADTFADDQYSQAVVSIEGLVGVRCTPSGTLKYYEFGAAPASSFIEVYDGTNWSSLALGSGVTGGQTIRCEIAGNAITAKVAGSTTITATDGTLASGAPFIHLYDTIGIQTLDDWLGGPITGGGSVGAAAGTGTAAGVGAATAASVGAAAGAGTATAVGASTAASVGAAAGIGAAPGVGASTAASVGAAAGIGAAPGVGASTAASVGAAAGTGTATGIGASTAASVGAAAGLGAAPGVGADASASGSIGAASGIGTATGVGASVAAAVGTASGTSDAPGVGASTAASAGAAAGLGDAPGVGRDGSAPATTGYAMALGGEDVFYQWWRRQKRAIEQPASATEEVDRVEPSPVAREAIRAVPTAILQKIDKAATSYDVRVIASGLGRIEAGIVEAVARAADEEAARQQEEEDVASVFLSLI